MLFCSVALASCDWMTTNTPLAKRLVAIAGNDYSRHVLLTSKDTPLDLEQTVDSLIADGFSPDFGEAWGTLKYQVCGSFSVPVWGSDKTDGHYDEALMNRSGGFLIWKEFRLSLRVAEGCKIVRVEGWQMRPTTL